MRASNSSRSALSFCKPCDGLATPCAARLLAASSAHATRHRSHYLCPSASVVVLQEGVLHAAVLSARGACQCAGLADAPHAHAGARSVLPGSGVAPARRTWSQVVRNRLSPNRGDGRVCRTHRRTMWRDCDSSAPRSPGFARAATILQASCPTAGWESCANVEEGVRSAGAAGREVARESGARRVDI